MKSRRTCPHPAVVAGPTPARAGPGPRSESLLAHTGPRSSPDRAGPRASPDCVPAVAPGAVPARSPPARADGPAGRGRFVSTPARAGPAFKLMALWLGAPGTTRRGDGRCWPAYPLWKGPRSESWPAHAGPRSSPALQPSSARGHGYSAVAACPWSSVAARVGQTGCQSQRQVSAAAAGQAGQEGVLCNQRHSVTTLPHDSRTGSLSQWAF